MAAMPFVYADAVLAQSAGAACFEVIPARPNIEPPVPIMIDKCSGRSWVLIRNGKSYRWSLIATESREGQDRRSRAGRWCGGGARKRIAEMLHLQQPEILRMKPLFGGASGRGGAADRACIRDLDRGSAERNHPDAGELRHAHPPGGGHIRYPDGDGLEVQDRWRRPDLGRDDANGDDPARPARADHPHGRADRQARLSRARRRWVCGCSRTTSSCCCGPSRPAASRPRSSLPARRPI